MLATELFTEGLLPTNPYMHVLLGYMYADDILLSFEYQPHRFNNYVTTFDGPSPVGARCREEITLPVLLAECTVEQFDAAVTAFIEKVNIVACPKCGHKMFAQNSGRLTADNFYGDGTKTGHICHVCEVKRLDDACKREAERNAKKQAADRAKFKGQGFTHEIEACIHPIRGGDDRFVRAYIKREPTPADIAHLLRNSRVKTDYRVNPL